MGMPVSNYTVFRTLGYGGEEYEKQAAIRALEGFKLFAIVIHDPETDPEFDQYLQQTFNRLDYITGDSLLFFALTDPSPEWLNRILISHSHLFGQHIHQEIYQELHK